MKMKELTSSLKQTMRAGSTASTQPMSTAAPNTADTQQHSACRSRMDKWPTDINRQVAAALVMGIPAAAVADALGLEYSRIRNMKRSKLWQRLYTELRDRRDDMAVYLGLAMSVAGNAKTPIELMALVAADLGCAQLHAKCFGMQHPPRRPGGPSTPHPNSLANLRPHPRIRP